MDVTLADVVAASRTVAATRSRTAKTDALAELFARCDPDEVGVVVAHLSGVLPQRRLGVGFRSLGSLPPPAGEASLTVAEVDAAFDRLAATAGAGSAASRRAELADLMGRATADEQAFLRDLITGNLRQGALDGVVLGAVAKAYAVPEPVVRRAAMLAGTAAETARLAASGGTVALEEVGLVVGRPVRPMLAASAKTAGEAVEAVGGGRAARRRQARRHPRAGAPSFRGGDRLHPQPRRDHRARAGGRRGGGGPARWRPRARRRGDRPARGRPTRAVPGDRGAHGELGRRCRAPGDGAAHDLPVRRAPPRRHRPHRRERDGAARGTARGGSPPHGAEGRDVGARRRGEVLRRARRGRARGRRREGRVEPVCGRAPGERLGQGQADAHPRPRRAGRRVGVRASARHALQHPPRGTRPAHRRVRHDRQDVQGHDRRDAPLADRPVHRAGGRRHGRVGRPPCGPSRSWRSPSTGCSARRRYPGGVALRFARVLRYRDDKTAEEADTIETVQALAPEG